MATTFYTTFSLLSKRLRPVFIKKIASLPMFLIPSLAPSASSIYLHLPPSPPECGGGGWSHLPVRVQPASPCSSLIEISHCWGQLCHITQPCKPQETSQFRKILLGHQERARPSLHLQHPLMRPPTAGQAVEQTQGTSVYVDLSKL